MMYHLVSNDVNNYNTVKLRSSINCVSGLVMYRIYSLSTIASFSMTTPDDYLLLETIINDESVELTLHFQEHGAYDLRTLSYTLNTLFEGQLVPIDESLPITLNVSMDSTNRLIISADKEFTIKEASHGAKLLLGLYHTQLPIHSSQKQIHCDSVPYVSYGNILYLTARTDFVSVLNTVEDKEITRSIAYKTNELLYPGYPINCRLPGQWSIIHSDQLSSLEFQLTDFQLVPIILHAPLNITIEIQRIDNTNQTSLTNLMEIL